MSTFSTRLRELRYKFLWKQSQVANRAGVSTSLISAYEKAERAPSVEMVIKLSDIFNCSTDYLLGVKQEQTLNISGLSDNQISLINGILAEFKKEADSALPKKS